MIMCDEHLLADSRQMSAEVNIQKIGLLGTLNNQQSFFEDEYIYGISATRLFQTRN